MEVLRTLAEDTEKFITAKAAEGKPVETMSVKTLRAEVRKFKADAEIQRKRAEKLADDVEGLKIQEGYFKNKIDQLQIENNKSIFISRRLAATSALKKLVVSLGAAALFFAVKSVPKSEFEFVEFFKMKRVRSCRAVKFPLFQSCAFSFIEN